MSRSQPPTSPDTAEQDEPKSNRMSSWILIPSVIVGVLAIAVLVAQALPWFYGWLWPPNPKIDRVYSVVNTNSANIELDVVFVHGLGGDKDTTWHPEGSPDAYFPRWIGEDRARIAVWSYDYNSAPSDYLGESVPTVQQATTLASRLKTVGVGQTRSVVFITHSLGGLVVKQMLHDGFSGTDERAKRVLENTRGVVFFATPHKGSNKADFVKMLNGIALGVGRLTESIDDLKYDASWLQPLDKFYSSRAEGLGIATQSFFEQVEIGNTAVIVDRISAHPGTSEEPIPVVADHVAICKPATKSDPRYLDVLQFLSSIAGEQEQPPRLTPGNLPDMTAIADFPETEKLNPLQNASQYPILDFANESDIDLDLFFLDCTKARVMPAGDMSPWRVAPIDSGKADRWPIFTDPTSGWTCFFARPQGGEASDDVCLGCINMLERAECNIVIQGKYPNLEIVDEQ